jgi:hypothetical protein
MKWGMMSLLACFALMIIWLERCYLVNLIAEIFPRWVKVPPYCTATVTLPPPPPPPTLGFNYASAPMKRADADALVSSLTAGTTTLERISAGSPFPQTFCTFYVNGSTGLHEPDWTGAALGTAHPNIHIHFSSSELPTQSSGNTCNQTLVARDILLDVSQITALNSTTSTGLASVLWSDDTKQEANPPSCGFLQFTPTRMDPNSDGSGNLTTAAGNFGFFLRSSCAGDTSDPETVVVVWGGNLMVSQ